MNLGIVGWDVASGLGYYNQDLARHLGASKWLVPDHPIYPNVGNPPLPICQRTSLTPDRKTLLQFLDGLDWLLFVETPYIDQLPELARRKGVKIAAIPMVENYNPRYDWVARVDLMLPPTRYCACILEKAKREFGFQWRLERVPGAVDTARFAFRQRDKCQRFLFCNGHGGVAWRKGAKCIADAARLVPEIPILVYSQSSKLPSMPANVEARFEASNPEDLYREGDVSIQPSRWEGLGLQLLEAQACGLPLVTTDGLPMNEYRPYRLIPTQQGTLEMNGLPMAVFEAQPDRLAEIMRDLWQKDISQASQEARQFVEDHHSWQVVAPRMKALLAQTENEPKVGEHASGNAGILARIPLSARRILHLGCGEGELGAAIRARLPAVVEGIEKDPDKARLAQQKLDHVVIGDAEQTEFPEGAFDCIVCGDILERIPEPQAFLAKIRGKLKVKGRLVARFTNMRHHSVVTQLLEGTWSWQPGGGLHKDQLHFLTRREIEKCFHLAWLRITNLAALPGPGQGDSNGRPGEVKVGPLHITGMAVQDAEDFYAEHFLVTAEQEPRVDHGLTSIVVVTHGRLASLQRCVESILHRTREHFEMIVVDNGSCDDTKDYLAFLDIKTIRNDEDRGFAAAAMQGLQAATGQQVALVQDDCVVTTGWLGQLLGVFNRDQTVGLVGPCTNGLSGPHQVEVNYDADLLGLDGFAWELGKTSHRKLLKTGRLEDFCLLARREALQVTGFLDGSTEPFSAKELCTRASKAGFEIAIAQDAFIHHASEPIKAKRSVEPSKQKDGSQAASVQTQDDDLDQSPTCQTYRLRPSAGKGLLLTPAKPQLSLCMIVRDNERTIEACLKSIRPWVDEMIVVDTGSKDRTPEIAKGLGAHVFHFPWPDSFSVARNESIKHAQGKWIFWMDSDDVIDTANGRKLRELAYSPAVPSLMGYVLQVHCPGSGEDGQHSITVVDHIKLFRNLPTLRFEGRIHEQILPAIRSHEGETAWTDIFVTHAGYDHSPEGQKRKLDRDLRLLHLELKDRPHHPFTLFNLGMTYSDMKEHAKAVDYLRQSLKHAGPGESHLRKVYSLLVYSYAQLGKQDEAWQVCQEGVGQFPQDVELKFRKAILLHDAGRLPEAVQEYQELLEKQEGRYFSSMDRGIRGFKARHNLAIVFTDMKDLARAEEQWQLVIAEEPGYRWGWRGLGEALLGQGKHQEALQLAKELFANPQLAAEGRLLRGQAAGALGDLATAQQELQQAARELPGDPEPARALRRLDKKPGLPSGQNTRTKAPDSQVPTGKELASILILCFNQLEYTQLCLQSVLRHSRPPYELLIVDNGSTDETPAYLDDLRTRPGPVRIDIIRNPENRGFPAGCNQALSRAHGRYLVFLNNDTVVTPGWLDGLVAWSLKDWPQNGMVGAVTNYSRPPQEIAVDYADLKGMEPFAARRKKEFAGKALDVERLTGFCLLARRDVLDLVGSLDEQFNQGFFEDDDLSVRVRQAGFKLVVAQDVFVHHFGSRTFTGLGVDCRAQLTRNFELFRKKWGNEHSAGYRLE